MEAKPHPVTVSGANRLQTTFAELLRELKEPCGDPAPVLLNQPVWEGGGGDLQWQQAPAPSPVSVGSGV